MILDFIVLSMVERLEKIPETKIQQICQNQQSQELNYNKADFEKFNNLVDFLNSCRIVVSQRTEVIIELVKKHCKEKIGWYTKGEQMTQNFKKRDQLIIKITKSIVSKNPTEKEMKLLFKIIPEKIRAILDGYF